MSFFEKALEANVMSIKLLIRANVSKSILYEAFNIAKEFELRYSAYDKNSFLNHINKESGEDRVACTQDDIKLFKRSIEASELSNGEFDITMGALSHGAYHFGFSNQSLASESLIKEKIKLVDYTLIDINNDSIYLKKKGMRLDLGGIGKGFVAKEIALFLKEKGATKMLVDVGGEIVTFGKSYTIGIKDPFSKINIAHIKTSKEVTSISTSGDYERYIDSRKTHHILNKFSGTSPIMYSSMTIIENSFDIDMLDAYATAMFNKDLDYVKRFSKKLNFSTISIDKDSNILLNNIRNLKLESIEF